MQLCVIATGLATLCCHNMHRHLLAFKLEAPLIKEQTGYSRLVWKAYKA